MAGDSPTRANGAGPPRRVLHLSTLPLLVGLVSAGLIVYFDLGTPLPFNDDWLYAWSAQHISLDGIQRLPWQFGTAYPQAVWGWLTTFGQAQEPYLRLTILPFVLLAAVSSYRIARTLGADKLWSGMAAVALLTTPVYLNLSTSFMSDVPYCALMLAAADAGVRWVQDGNARGQFVAWTALAILQRQVGAGIVAALTLALLLGWRSRRPGSRDLIWLGATWVAVFAITLGPVVLGLRTQIEQSYLDLVLNSQGAYLQRAWEYLPAMLGIFLIPFAAGILFQRRGAESLPLRSPRNLITLVAVALGGIGLFAAIGQLTSRQEIFPGDIWSRAGYVITSRGTKPSVYPEGVWLVVEVAAIGSAAILLLLRARSWAKISILPAAMFLLIAAAVQMVEIMLTFTFDRYYLVPAALLVPVVATIASRSALPRVALAWAMLASLAGLSMHVVAQQDYEAWQVARDKAARFAYQFAAPETVLVGYEPYAVYVVVPEYERDNSIDVNSATNFLINGPDHARIVVVYALADDPNPGFTYDSVAPGKIVILGLPPGTSPP